MIQVHLLVSDKWSKPISLFLTSDPSPSPCFWQVWLISVRVYMVFVIDFSTDLNLLIDISLLLFCCWKVNRYLHYYFKSYMALTLVRLKSWPLLLDLRVGLILNLRYKRFQVNEGYCVFVCIYIYYIYIYAECQTVQVYIALDIVCPILYRLWIEGTYKWLFSDFDNINDSIFIPPREKTQLRIASLGNSV